MAEMFQQAPFFYELPVTEFIAELVKRLSDIENLNRKNLIKTALQDTKIADDVITQFVSNCWDEDCISSGGIDFLRKHQAKEITHLEEKGNDFIHQFAKKCWDSDFKINQEFLNAAKERDLLNEENKVSNDLKTAIAQHINKLPSKLNDIRVACAHITANKMPPAERSHFVDDRELLVKNIQRRMEFFTLHHSYSKMNNMRSLCQDTACPKP